MDGKYYINLCEKGQFLYNNLNISLIFNIDGVLLYLLFSVFLWFVFFVINEFFFFDRFVMKVFMKNIVVKNDNKLCFFVEQMFFFCLLYLVVYYLGDSVSCLCIFIKLI